MLSGLKCAYRVRLSLPIESIELLVTFTTRLLDRNYFVDDRDVLKRLGRI